MSVLPTENFGSTFCSIDALRQLLASLKQFGTGDRNSQLCRWQTDFTRLTGKGVRIALLDAGINWQHPLFAKTRIDAKDFTKSGSLADPLQHGTNMAALLVGEYGLVPEAELLCAKVLSSSPSKPSENYISRGIKWAVSRQADIIILPFGRAQASRKIGTAIRQALDCQIQVFAAAGNAGSGRILFPASLSGVTAVTGADLTGKILPGCSAGELVDLVALGKVPSIEPDLPIVGSSPATVIAGAIAALKLSPRNRSQPNMSDV